ncbi:MAG: ABC transporter permease [Candidatus Hydrogenedentota bacterium]
MRTRDLIRYTTSAVASHRLRSILTMLGIVIGIASVILLTSIGEGTRQYILSEFMQFGANLLQVTPGRSKTTGPAGVFGGTLHPLTLDDAAAVARIPGVEKVVPVAFGTARVESSDRARSVFIYGVTAEMTDVWKFKLRQGSFLPPGDPRHGAPLAVIGPGLKREIFGDRNALGEHVRIGGERFLVIGIMAPKGYMLGINIDDAAYIPVSRALPIFNREGLMEIDVLFSNVSATHAVSESIRKSLISLHRGDEDFTIVTQTEMLGTLEDVIRIVSAAVLGIGAISLIVGAIGILTMMWISVNERTAEIGLAKALGATNGQILMLFIGEAVMLSTTGGIIGLATGFGLSRLLGYFVPQLPLATPIEFAVLAIGVSFIVGMLSGVLPARRAAMLDPVEALSAE